MDRFEISVVVPIYNVKPWLSECVNSILEQEIDVPFEVLLVDDGSTDGCAELCEAFAAQYPHVKVIDAAQGRYYAFVDADDRTCPGFLQTLYNACEEHDAYMSLCAFERIHGDGSAYEPRNIERPVAEGVFCGKELLQNFLGPGGLTYTVAWNKLYRAEVWKLLHYPEGRLHEDEFVPHRLFWRCDKVVCVDKVLYNYRSRNGSIMLSKLCPERFDGVDGLVDRYRFYVEKGTSPELIDETYAACWRRYLYLCGLIRRNPTPELVEAISKQQFVMQGLLDYLPNCRAMKMSDKLSAARWSMMSAESLCPLKKD